MIFIRDWISVVTALIEGMEDIALFTKLIRDRNLQTFI
jgi:hypothetical protein